MDTNTIKLTGTMITGIQPNPGFMMSGSDKYETALTIVNTDKNGVWTITFKGDRKGSKDVGKSFNEICGGENHVYAPDHGSGTPGGLNFYFGVTMTLAVNGKKVETIVYLGQGNHGDTNNWWIGGTNVIPSKKGAVFTFCENGELNISGTHDSLTLNVP